MAKKSVAKIPSGSVDVEVSGDSRAVEHMLQGLGRALSPDAITSQLLRDDVYNILLNRARGRFASEGDDVSGGPWASLRPFTQEQRRRGGFGAEGPINVRTGQLKRHILDRPVDADPNTLGGTLWFPARGGAGKALSKLNVAQVGMKKPKTLPRPVLGVNLLDMELVLTATANHLARHQRGGSGRLF